MVEAGIAPGMRVLDCGSGVGDVAFLVAELVGEAGKVVGADRSEEALTLARSRAAERSLDNVSFHEGDPTQLAFEEPFDAVVGRYVLMFQPDAAAMLRGVAAHARVGGLVFFHEPYRDTIRSYPPVPTYDRCCDLVTEAVRRLGGDPILGLKLHATFLAAGLQAPVLRLEAVIAGGDTVGSQVHFELDLVETLISDMERMGLVAPGELDPESVADLAIEEAKASESVIIGRGEVGAWARAA
jgi:SAM-dependent methyltransferase